METATKLKPTTQLLLQILQRLEWASKKNGWQEQGQYYVHISRTKLADELNVTEKTITAHMRKLVMAGLIRVRRMGLTKTNRIFLLHAVENQTQTAETIKENNSPSGKEKITFQEGNISPTEIYSINSSPNSITSIYLSDRTKGNAGNANRRDRQIDKASHGIKKDNTDTRPEIYHQLLQQTGLDRPQFDDEEYQNALIGIVEMVADACMSTKPISISGCPVSISNFRNTMLKIGLEEIETVKQNIFREADKGNRIKNIRNYTIASLYNAVQLRAIIA